MKWISVLGKMVRDAWLMIGMACLLVLVTNALLDSWLELPMGAQVVSGSEAPDKWGADFYRDASWVADYQQEFRSARQLRWEPYAYWRRQPFAGQHINVDDRGHRKTWQPENLTDESPAVWVFGGSTVWGSGARDDYTIPSALSRELAEAGMPARVINLGERGWVRGQALAYLQQRLLRGERPAMVIFYDGANDVFADAIQNASGAPQNEGNRMVEFRSATNIGQWLKAGFNQLTGFKKLIADAPPAESEAHREKLASAIVSRYEGQVDQLRALAVAYDFAALVAWQPVIFSRLTTSAFEQEVINASLLAHREIHLSSTEKVRASALAGNPDFVDLSSVLDQTPQPVFMDFCHVSEAANEIVAQALLRRILPRLGSGA